MAKIKVGSTFLDGKVIASTDIATTLANGLMSSVDKSKLDGVAESANNYSLPTATASVLGGVKSGTDITVDLEGNVSVLDDSHNHLIANVDGLQTALDGKVDDSQVLTDVPAGALFTDTIYTHPTGDGNLHVPATGTTNDGNVLKAGPTAGSLVWAPDNDTIYEHPANHLPSIITQDASNRFVTDVQIAAWNSKAEGDHTHPELHTHSNKTVLDGLTDSGGELLYNGSQIAPELAGTTWGDLIPIV